MNPRLSAFFRGGFGAGLILPAMLLLTACGAGSQAGEGAPAENGESTSTGDEKQPEFGGDIIECAIGGGQWFLRECEAIRVREEDGTLTLVVRHLDGGFRRFTVLTDGRGLEPADGAEQAMIEVLDSRLDVQVGQDRYRFPATIRSNDSGE